MGIVTACAGLVLTGCAAGPTSSVHAGTAAPAPQDDQRYLACSRFFQNMGQVVADAGVRDVQAALVPDYPYLRQNRFLASFGDRPLSYTDEQAWADRLQALGEKGWAVELANLPRDRRAALSRDAPGGLPLAQAVHQCGTHMRALDLASLQGLKQLRAHVGVPSEYRATWRALGLYPLTAVFFSFGVDRFHHDTLATFARPRRALTTHGTLTRYIPPPGDTLSAAEVADILSRSSLDNPLRIPTPDPAERRRLFATFAPVWEVDVVGTDDRIGAPHWTDKEAPQVDTGRPVVYHLISHAWWHGEAVLQLNYIIWFPARPPAGALDPYAGHMDGIDLRVTLDPTGRPLLYDSIHNCGCFQMFFPTGRVRIRPPGHRAQGEPPLVPQIAPQIGKGERLVVRIAQRTHSLERLYADHDPQGRIYEVAAYDTLRSLPTPGGGHRSLFDDQGFVPGTERAERWWLWPMGVPNPGAMRQWGHHATAFVGTRYFDAPHLLEKLFDPVPLHAFRAAQ